jgi:type VI secretion system secreted protein Hcp
MALNAYLKIKAQKSGQVKGSVTQKGREDSIQVIAINHEIVSPRDAASGLPTGKRQHKPLVITKELDKSSPLLYQILATNENIPEFELKFYAAQVKATSGVGAEVNHYTIKLTNANIAQINFKMLNNRNPEQSRYPELEEVAFTYQKIEWLWNDGGIMAQDDWESPISG